MSSLKYQPSKASETYYQIWLFFFCQFAVMMTTVVCSDSFVLCGVGVRVWRGICGEFFLFNGGLYSSSGRILWQSATQE